MNITFDSQTNTAHISVCQRKIFSIYDPINFATRSTIFSVLSFGCGATIPKIMSALGAPGIIVEVAAEGFIGIGVGGAVVTIGGLILATRVMEQVRQQIARPAKKVTQKS